MCNNVAQFMIYSPKYPHDPSYSCSEHLPEMVEEGENIVTASDIPQGTLCCYAGTIKLALQTCDYTLCLDGKRIYTKWGIRRDALFDYFTHRRTSPYLYSLHPDLDHIENYIWIKRPRLDHKRKVLYARSDPIQEEPAR